MIASIIDSVSAWLYRRRYEAAQRRRRLAEQRAASSTWFVAFAVAASVPAPGCAHIRHTRMVNEIRESCAYRIDAESDTARKVEIFIQCEQDIRAVGEE